MPRRPAPSARHASTGARSRRRPEAGFSLIELMIALVVGAALLAIVVRMVAATLATYRSDEYLARLQENARYALEQIGFDGRMAGFSGCARAINNLLDTSSAAYEPSLYDLLPLNVGDPPRSISGWEYDATGTGNSYAITTLDPAGVALNKWSAPGANSLVDDLQNLVVPGTDVLVLKHAEQVLSVGATGNTPANAASISLSGASGVNQNTLILVSDCQGSDLFQNRAANNASTLSRGSGGSPGNVPPSTNLSHAYGPDMEIYTFTVVVYYIGRGASGEPALFRRSYARGGAGETQEIVEGVENLQVVYGEDTNDDSLADIYRPATQVVNWGDVVSLRVGLLLRTVESGRQENDTRTYNLLGTTITPRAEDARRHRRVFTTTIALRNRVG